MGKITASCQPNILEIGSQKIHESTNIILDKELKRKEKKKWPLQLVAYQS